MSSTRPLLRSVALLLLLPPAASSLGEITTLRGRVEATVIQYDKGQPVAEEQALDVFPQTSPLPLRVLALVQARADLGRPARRRIGRCSALRPHDRRRPRSG
ncbi:MAG: hypothetical protein IPM64_00450 [Phycisphaerales bacterium]|nr:hypothetical protein [Phycisphaerales bacterium]